MRRALELAATATGKTFPNPVVGCVIVDPSGEVVGAGSIQKPENPTPRCSPFAPQAIRREGAPRTSPLNRVITSDAPRPVLARSSTRASPRVVVGFVDPDPRVSGGGIRTLLDAGIEVVVGCEEEACRAINADFIERNTST